MGYVAILIRHCWRCFCIRRNTNNIMKQQVIRFPLRQFMELNIFCAFLVCIYAYVNSLYRFKVIFIIPCIFIYVLSDTFMCDISCFINVLMCYITSYSFFLVILQHIYWSSKSMHVRCKLYILFCYLIFVLQNEGMFCFHHMVV